MIGKRSKPMRFFGMICKICFKNAIDFILRNYKPEIIYNLLNKHAKQCYFFVRLKRLIQEHFIIQPNDYSVEILRDL